MGKETAIHSLYGISVSLSKEGNPAIWGHPDDRGGRYAERSQTQKEKHYTTRLRWES